MSERRILLGRAIVGGLTYGQRVTTAELADLLRPVAAKAKVERLFWLSNPDDGERFCRSCAEKAAQPGQIVDGGWGTEEDGSQTCDTCGVLLDCAFTDYGAEEELRHFRENPARSAEDAWCVLNAVEARGDASWVIGFRRVRHQTTELRASVEERE